MRRAPASSPNSLAASRLSRVVLLALTLVATSAQAAPPVPTAPPTTTDPTINRAKELFHRGVVLFEAGDMERALELFFQSRGAYPSLQNTSNVAICLDRLGRYDEALELYEQLLTEFNQGLQPGETETLTRAMTTLRTRVGNVWIAADVAGAQVVVDGRARATLPLVVPIRVLPGTRVVRVIKDGYITRETRTDVIVNAETKVEVHLEPLANAGLLRIEDSVSATRLFVDGTVVGTTPWEGTLGPGRHVVWTQKEDLGTAPKEVVVVQGQKAIVAVEASALGAELAVDAEPASASLAVDGVDVAVGRWRGRLPLGVHRVSSSESGYHALAVAVESSAAATAPVRLRLIVDPGHPRWPRSAPGHPFFEAVGGYLLAPRLASDAEVNCSSCPSSALAHGLIAGLRGGYRFPAGVSLALMGGYLRAASTFSRTLPSSAPTTEHPTLAYDLTDHLVVHGPFGAFGVGYQRALGARFALSAHAMVGAAMSSGRDVADVAVVSGSERIAATVVDSDPVSTAGVLLLEGDVGATMRVGDWDLGLAVAALGLLLQGPPLDGRSVAIAYDPTCTAGSLACVASGTPLPDERAHGRTIALSPLFSIGRSF